jgi:hypothetical protein
MVIRGLGGQVGERGVLGQKVQGFRGKGQVLQSIAWQGDYSQ